MVCKSLLISRQHPVHVSESTMELNYGFSNPMLVSSSGSPLLMLCSSEILLFIFLPSITALLVKYFIEYRKTHIIVRFIPQVEDKIIDIYHTYIELGYDHDARLMERTFDAHSVLATLLVATKSDDRWPLLIYCRKYHEELFNEITPVLEGADE